MPTTDDQIVVAKDDIIMEGYLVKQSRYMKDWRRRYVVLTKQYLCTFKEEDDRSILTEALPLHLCSSVSPAWDDTGDDHSFRVDTPGRVFYLLADTHADKDWWMGGISCQMMSPAMMHIEDHADRMIDRDLCQDLVLIYAGI